MLELTILKVRHSDETEARKLLPHISQCDVYSPECSGQTTTQASRLEQLFLRWFQESRTKFLETLNKSVKPQRGSNMTYYIKETDYLYRAKKPVWFAERNTVEEANILGLLYSEGHTLTKQSFNALCCGNLTEFVEKQYRANIIYDRASKLRDENMGKNINNAENHIRQLYPQLCSIEPLKYTIRIGAMHSPEKYTFIPAKIQMLVDYADFKEELIKKIADGRSSIEDCKRDLAVFGISKISKEYRIGLTKEELQKNSFEELLKITKEIFKKASSRRQNEV